MPESGPGEVGSLEQSFKMIDSLAASRNEQGALRRVATLVALGVPPPEVFRAVASETGRVLGAKATVVPRFEPDGGGQQDVAAQWSRTVDGLTDAIQELRDITCGLHPAVLEKHGVAPALRELVRPLEASPPSST